MAQAPDRGVVQNPLAQHGSAAAGLHPVVALPSVHTAPNADFSKVGAEDLALAQVMQAGADFANKQYKESLKTDFVDGQMAMQQGKSLEEYNMVATSHAFVSGFRSMQAQTLADNMYAEQKAAIDTGDYELTPEAFRAKQTAQFKKMLTGNEETDRYIAQLSVDVNGKLAKEHTVKHEAWKVEETKNSLADLYASKGKLAANSPEDAEQLALLLRNPKAIPGMERLSEQAVKDSVVQGIVKSLDSGHSAVLDSLKGVLHGESAKGMRGVDGLEKAGFDKQQFASIREAYSRWNEKKQSEYNASFEQGRDDLLEQARMGKLPREVFQAKMQGLFAEYGKDPDRQLTMAVREGLTQYGEYSPVVMDLTMKAAQAARNGMSWEKIKPGLDKQLDDMNATSQTRRQVYAVAAQGVEGWQRRQEAKADAAYERAQARQEKINTAVQVMSAGGAYALSTEERRLGYMAREQAENQALVQAQQTARAKGIPFDMQQALDRKNESMAKYISLQGVQSPLHADKWTAGLMSAVQDGKSSPLAQQTVGELMALAKINPALAMEHLHGDDAKAFGKIVLDCASSGMDPSMALNAAVARTKVNADKDTTKAAKGVSDALVKELAPGAFLGAGHVYSFGIGARNAEKIMQNSPVLTNEVLAEANKVKSMFPNFSEAQAVEQAALRIKPRTGIVGSNVLVTKDRSIAQTFGLGELKNQDDLHGIVMHTIQRVGPQLWGSDWEKTQGLVDSANRGLGDEPRLHMALDNISKHLVVTTFNEDGSIGSTKRIPAKMIGEQWRHDGLDPSQVALPIIKATRATKQLGKALIGDTNVQVVADPERGNIIVNK